jgi:hypothetical protein
MGRVLVIGIVIGGTAGISFAAGAYLAGGDGIPGRKPRDWFDLVDLGLRLATLCVFVGGLVGTFAVLTSLRASAYGQVYGRFQTMLLKLAEHPEWFERMRRDEYTAEEEGSVGPTYAHRFAANAMVNMYEEAYMLSRARVLRVFGMMPADYWESMVGSMRSAFQLRYVRTHWERRQDCFPPTFNRFVRDEILRDGGQETVAPVTSTRPT